MFQGEEQLRSEWTAPPDSTDADKGCQKDKSAIAFCVKGMREGERHFDIQNVKGTLKPIAIQLFPNRLSKRTQSAA